MKTLLIAIVIVAVLFFVALFVIGAKIGSDFNNDILRDEYVEDLYGAEFTKEAKELDDDLKIHSQYIRHIDGSRHLIVCYTDYGVRLANNNFFNYSELLLNLKCTWSDGTPFGRKEGGDE